MKKKDKLDSDVIEMMIDNEINFSPTNQPYKSLKLQKLKSFLLVFVLLSALITLLIGLIVNYLVYYPKSNAENGVDKTYLISDNVGSFTIAMIFSGIIIAFTIFLVITLKKYLVIDSTKDMVKLTTIGFIASFADTISIGSYGVTMGLNKAFKTKMIPSKMPGNMIIGYVPPQLLESTIFLGAFEFDVVTLISMTAACIIGGLLGAWVSKYVNNQIFRLFSGTSLFIFGIVMILVHPNVAVIAAVAETTFSLSGWRLAVGIISYFLLGIFSALGLGIFAPSLAILTLLSLDIGTIFITMSVGAAAMMPPAAIKFMKDKNYDPKIVLLFAIGGVWGCLTSFLVVFLGIQIGAGIDWDTFTKVLKWIAIGVIFYCSFLMLFDFGRVYKTKGWKEES